MKSAIVWLGVTLAAHAVVIDSGALNNTAPMGQPYFGNVGVLNGASAIYLSNQWVMTASHVAGSLPASVSFGGTSYATQAGSWQQISNSGLEPGLTAFADIVLFRLATSPGLPTLTLRTTAPAVGNNVMMIGNGKVQEAGLTYWTVNTAPDPDVWNEVTLPTPFDREGFKTTAANQVRWGTNEVAIADETVNAGAGDTKSFITTYNTTGASNEAQGVLGDSGGAVLFDTGSGWELAGMMHAIGTFDGQPSPTTAVSGNETYHANLSAYASQVNAIVATVPETSSSMLVGMAMLMCLTRRLR